MKNNAWSMAEDDYEFSKSAYCWWRSASKFEECVGLKHDLKVSSLTPRLRVLRELERLALIAPDGLHQLKHKLITYSSGDFWVPTGGIKKDDMNIPPVATILLVGFSGSGKSSLVNLMYSILGHSGLIPFAQTSIGSSSNYTTMYLQEHNVVRCTQSGFCVYDSRGFNYKGMDESLEQLSGWMTEGIHHNQLCVRSGGNLCMEDDMENSELTQSPKFVKRTVNCVMVVANIAEIYGALKTGDLKPLEATKELFSCPLLRRCNENPILIFTHGDMLETEERIDARLKVCEYLGISETTGVYDIACLSEYGILVEESDPVTAYALTEAVYRALLISDRSHVPVNKIQDWLVMILSWLLCKLAALFSYLAQLCNKLRDKLESLK